MTNNATHPARRQCLTLVCGLALASPSMAADFDGDGFDDVAVGCPLDNRPNLADFGSVTIIRGGPQGLTADGSVVLSLDTLFVPGTAAAGDRFGAATATGNFNGDAFMDLAVGVPGRRVNDKVAAGEVVIFYGSDHGLTGASSQVFDQDTTGVEDTADQADSFGEVLVAGDFNGDGRDDLAIGIPGEDINFVGQVGAVAVLRGTAGGLTAKADQFWTQDTPGMLSSCEADDRFGASLAAGDFNADGRDDLAIGVTGEALTLEAQGAVSVILGSGTGLVAAGNQLWNIDSPGITGTAAANDRFGFALAAGNFGHDIGDDLAIAAPFADLAAPNCGAVWIIYAQGASGLASADNTRISQDSPGVLESCEDSDNFGRCLAAGRINGDGFSDLVVGCPLEDIGVVTNGGVVNILYGRSAGMDGTGSQIFHQNFGIGGDAEFGDTFGASVSLTGGPSLNGDDRADLIVGVPFEEGAAQNAGAIQVILSNGTALTGTGSQLIDQETPGIGGDSFINDRWGQAVAAR